MNDSDYKISLDITEHGSQAVLKAKKTDTGRKIYISLRAGGTPSTIAEDCYAVFKATKPDGSILFNACTIEGNEIIYEFTEQTCAAVGRCRCEIALYGLDDTLITCPRFALLVDGTIYPDGRVESTDEFSALTRMVSDTLEVQGLTRVATENANTATENAVQATTNATNAAESINGLTVTSQTVEYGTGAVVKAGLTEPCFPRDHGHCLKPLLSHWEQRDRLSHLERPSQLKRSSQGGAGRGIQESQG